MTILSADTLNDAVKAVIGGKHYGGRWWADGPDLKNWLKLEVHSQKTGVVGNVLRFPDAFASAMAFTQAKMHFPGYLRKLSFVRIPNVYHTGQQVEGGYHVFDRGTDGDHYEIWRIRHTPVL